MLNCRKWSENWLQVYKRVNRIHLNKWGLPSDVLWWLMDNMGGEGGYFAAIGDLIKHGKLKRKTYINYNTVVRRMLEKHDVLYGTKWLRNHGWWFKKIKSERRLKDALRDLRVVIRFMIKEQKKFIKK